MESKKRIEAAVNSRVWMRVGSARWSGFPLSVKRRFLGGLERIAALQSAIAADSYLDEMPPVEIVCELWWHADHLIFGHATPLPWRKTYVFGARLPAPTALCEDEAQVRRALVHEFSHCLHMTGVVAAALSQGSKGLSDDFNAFDGAEDDARHVDPHLWFGMRDANEFQRHNDGEILVAVEPVFRSLEGIVPAGRPICEYHVTRLGIPDDFERRLSAIKNNGLS